MKPYIVLIIVLISANTFSQDLANLENKMGFNKFKLETSFEIHKSNLTFIIEDHDKVKFYEYTGIEISSVFSVPFEKITLGYYRNRLYLISITFNFTTEEQDVKIQGKLKELFGNTKISHNVKMSEDATYEWVMQWESKNVLLQFEKYDYSNSKSKLWSSDIYLYSKRIRNEINNDSF